jgi:hypothetical protein
MSFNFPFAPGRFSSFMEGPDQRLRTRFDGRACFSAENWAGHFQSFSFTQGFRVMTPNLVPPWNRVAVFADANAQGRVEAVGLNGYAHASVSVRLRVMDLSMRVLAEVGPLSFGGAWISIPWFGSLAFPFASNQGLNAVFNTSSTAPLIVEVRINSTAAGFGWGYGIADISNACLNAIRVFSM